ncbi:hypothetical protein [Tahibacter amnicola]|uniref:Anti-sigma factor n=1 Tax=Tahibacter amnicola TaxID=2976241 RepID=A0ABY6BF59_9GAMM|nr:hypothetical protein [Tahibacter amnicola]UXI68417.1 hypothetical protein N4264_01820 [Tahibacter amnicola]
MKSLSLGALPEFDPPPDLWTKIQAERTRRIRRRGQWRWGSGIAAALVLGVAGWVGLPAGPGNDPLVLLEQESHQLELAYAALDHSGLPLESAAELRAVEQALQQAYDRGAGHAELTPLWRQRNEVLSSLIALSAAGAQLTRI